MSRAKIRLCPHCSLALPPISRMTVVGVAPRPVAEPREDSWTGIVGKYLRSHREVTTVDTVLEDLDLPQTVASRIRVAKLLKAFGRVKVRRRVGHQRQWAYEVPGSATPKPPPPPVPVRVTQAQQLRDAVSRWLLDVGDTPVTIDEILAGLKLEFSHTHRIQVGRILVRDFGRTRVARVVGGARIFVYERYATTTACEPSTAVVSGLGEGTS